MMLAAFEFIADLGWLKANYREFFSWVLLLYAVAEIVTLATPSKKDDALLERVGRIISRAKNWLGLKGWTVKRDR